MPRKKKTEEVKVEVKFIEIKRVDYGTGMTRKNNELMAKEEEGNE